MKNPLCTEARIFLRHVGKQLNRDALDAAGVFGQFERLNSETMDAVGQSLHALSPPRRVAKIKGWMQALERIPSFRAGRMGDISNRQINAALIGPWAGVSGHLMQRTAALL